MAGNCRPSCAVELFDLPAGALQAVIGGEWRDEAIIYDDLTLPVDDGRNVKAAFTELSVPLISSTPYARGDVLSMTLAARLDDYSDFGSTVNPQFGLMWRPAPDLSATRLLWQELPSAFIVRIAFAAQRAVQHFSARSRRNDAVSNVSFVVGGNPDLQPIEADSLTAGFVLTPSSVPGLRLLATTGGSAPTIA